MQADFWHQRWEQNQIGFHLDAAHPLLVQHFKAPANSTVFVPLCGKTLDIAWLLDQGHQVIGIELSELAVKQLFEGLNLTPTITQTGALQQYQAGALRVYAGDVFSLTVNQLGSVDYVYDRAALDALPDEMRALYTQHLMSLTKTAPQYLITIDYDQSVMDGPPFAIDETLMQSYYQAHYRCDNLAKMPIEGGLKGKVEADEYLWQLS